MRPVLPRLHGATVIGRMRTDPGSLLLVGLVVMLTTALTSAVGPLVAQTSDRALAGAVRRAGPPAQVVATFPRADEDIERRHRDVRAVAEFRTQAIVAQQQLSPPVAAVVERGVASIDSPALQVLGAGPGRYLTLTYLDSRSGPPRIHVVAGRAPRAAAPNAAPSVEVALSQAAANVLGLRPGDRISAQDDQARPVAARVSGIFVADDVSDPRWQASTKLLHPERSTSEGVQHVTAAALVLPATLPDLRLAVPADDLTEQVSFTPRPDRMRWTSSSQVIRSVGALKASPSLALGKVAWDSGLDHVLTVARSQVSAARGQADVLVIGLLICALLVLSQAAGLLVRRRTGSVVLTRERGGSLLGVGAELFLECAAFSVSGAVLGLLVTRFTVGSVGWTWWVPFPLVAALAAALTGVVVASRATDPRRVPANRSARRRLARAVRWRRALLVGAVLAAAALTLVTLRARGVLGAGAGGDPTPATAPAWGIVAGALVLAPLVPLGAGILLDAARRTTGASVFFVAARVRATGVRTLPLVVLTVTVAQLVLAVALSSTEQRGQAAGALLSVGGDARIALPDDGSAKDVARRAGSDRGVRHAVAARVEDDVRATARGAAGAVRLVVVGATAYRRLLGASALADAPQLARLIRGSGAAVPALLLGGGDGLRDGLSVRASGAVSVSLRVVGTAPRVQGSTAPVVVVDARRYSRAGGDPTPNTVWLVGPGSSAAARTEAGPDGKVTRYAEVLAARRGAPLASGLVHLATASAALMLLLAVLAVAMGAASEAVPRAQSLGRLRALGLRDGQLWWVLAGELAIPVLLAVLAGLGLGLTAASSTFGSLSLERITGQVTSPAIHLPVWAPASLLVLLLTVVVLAQLEWTRLRRIALGELLRGGGAGQASG